MAGIKNVVMRDDLNPEHFDLENAQGNNQINVKFPAMPTGIITEMTIDVGEKKLKYKEDGVPKEKDLSFLAVDISTSEATFDARTTTLTISQTNGGQAVTVNLAELTTVKVENPQANAVTISGDGSEGNKLSADVKIKAGEENLLTKGDTGELDVSKAKVKEAATEATTEHLATLDTVTLKNFDGTQTIGKFYVAPSTD